MGKQQDREKIVQEIKVAADLYRKPGVATNLSEKKFYSYAAKKMLQKSR